MLGNLLHKPRTRRDAGTLALDLTTDEIVLYEHAGPGCWKKFASVTLNDPEFPIVLGLLRDEAEAHAGKLKPVHLWLPADHVIKLQVRIKNGTPRARLQAGFDYIDKETSYRPEDVAIAVAPSDQDGQTTLLIIFNKTWREVTDCATRWGFDPGEISTRHHSMDFGINGPIFHLKPASSGFLTHKSRPRIAASVMALVAIAGGLAVWSQGPWSGNNRAAHQLSETPATEIASALPAPTPPIIEPPAAPDPTLRAEAPPPPYFPDTPTPHSQVNAGQPPDINTALKGPKYTVPVFTIITSPVLASVPSAPPTLKPWRDPFAGWTDSLTITEPSVISPQPVMMTNFQALKPRPTWREKVSLFDINASSPWISEPVPSVTLPPPEPVEIAIAVFKPVPQVKITPVIVSMSTAKVEWSVPRRVVASAKPTAPVIRKQPITASYAQLSFPVPLPRLAQPSSGDATTENAKPPSKTVDDQTDVVAMPVPRPPRPAVSGTQSNAAMIAGTSEGNTTATPTEPASLSQTQSEREDPDVPTNLASVSSPLPTSRPAVPDGYGEASSPSVLPILSGSANSSGQQAATDPGLPTGHLMLVGILEQDGGRKALLWLPDGSYHKVIVGDVLDGWRVSLIGVDAMRFTRNGEDHTLLLLNR